MSEPVRVTSYQLLTMGATRQQTDAVLRSEPAQATVDGSTGGEAVVGARSAGLSYISSNLGTITAGVVQNAAGTARLDLDNSRLVFDNGTVVKIVGLGFGTSNQFIEWVGLRASIVSGGAVSVALCSESNAIQYLKTNGSAYFRGTLQVGTITVSGQSTDSTATALIEIGPYGSNGGVITVVYSFVASGLHGWSDTSSTPVAASYSCSFTIALERSINGGAYSTVATQTINGTQIVTREGPEGGIYLHAVDTAASGSFTYNDNAQLAQDRKYRWSITSRTLGYGTYNGYSQNLSITSQE